MSINSVFFTKSTFFNILMVFGLVGCATQTNDSPQTSREPAEPGSAFQCAGEVAAPALLATRLTEIEAPELVAQSVKGPEQGDLCQAKAYRVNRSFEVFRGWNSNNPGSELGKWWAFTMPAGRISEYREDFAICPSWSPLDMMTRCTLKEGAKVVLGTGQSARCNPYLTYPASGEVQIYLDDGEHNLLQCTSYYGVFSWQPTVSTLPDSNP